MPAKFSPTTSKLTRKFTSQRFEKICTELANSDKSLAAICRKYGVAPCTFYNWIKLDKKLAEQYAAAREQQADYIADQIIEIADDDSKDMITDPVSRELRPNPVSIQRSRLRIEARKWRIAILSPKKYAAAKIIEVPVQPEAIIIDWTAEGYKKAQEEDLRITGATYERLMEIEREEQQKKGNVDLGV